jgi:hypothetical protein
MSTILVTLLSVVALAVVDLKAEVTVKEYRTRMASRDSAVIAATRLYIKGVGEGIGWANNEPTTGRKPFYCPPEKLAVNLENYMDILNRQIKTLSMRLTQSQLEEAWIGLLLLKGLQEAFPCASD